MNAVIFGCGWQGKRHVKALNELNVNLDCIIDINPEAVGKALPSFPNNKIYDDVDKCLINHNLDIAIISTTSSARLSCIRKCVEYGIKKIFCEKPIATNLKDAEEIIKLTESNQCMLSVNHLRRWSPDHLRMKELINKGIIGQIKHIYYQSGSAGLGNVGSHIIDIIRFYTNSEIDYVLGLLDKTNPPNVRGPQFNDPGGCGVILMKDKTRIFLDIFDDTGIPPVLIIVGVHGRIMIDELNNNWTIRSRNNSDWDIPLTMLATKLYNIDFNDTIKWDVGLLTKYALKDLIYNNNTNCSGYDGYKAIEGAIALHISNINNFSKVKLPIKDRDHLSFEVKWP